MADYKYNDFIKIIETMSLDEITPIYLIHGDEYLVKTVFKQLKVKLLPEKKRKTNITSVDGANDNIPSAIELLNTFSLMPGTRIIAINDSQIFYAGQDRSALLEKGQAAFNDNQIKKAARFFLNLMAVSKLTMNVIQSNLEETIEALTKDQGDIAQHTQWLKAVADYCISQNMSVPDLMNYSDMLTEAIDKGFAQRNILIITTDTVQRNRRLYKAIARHGTVVNCQVAKGFVKAEKDQQEKTFRENAQHILAQSGKSMSSEAFAVMRQMMDASLRGFTVNLEKLIQYVGERKNITREDVEAVLERSRQDPIFELTNAIADRKITNALTVLDNLFTNQFYPLQALAAIANQIRKALLIVDAKSRYQDSYHKGMSFAQFKNQFFPNVLAYDQLLVDEASAETEEMASSTQKK
ncbi:MAG: DNA polymerase III subunit delta [Candidatus Magnetoglobus multicellularis str. Araruama]|uniref:DNA polymerase III subunit delta n=1 Tax=Candidatus Magnetoglobus multicellularis str. Araruama TaxID=890399 RepID=A0A1V1P9J1_9BACT|nr:MAG: DNA polymerase III subunit delta [Candidatus Magnetoglobus multicellularis str. Araruama]